MNNVPGIYVFGVKIKKHTGCNGNAVFSRVHRETNCIADILSKTGARMISCWIHLGPICFGFDCVVG